MKAGEREAPPGDDVNDHYVRGEERQGIMFYLLAFLMAALALAFAIQVYGYLSALGAGAFRAAVDFAASLAVGATVGIFAYNAFNGFKLVQAMLRNSLKASPHVFPEVYAAVRVAAGRLSMAVPDAFITQSPSVNAYMVRLGLARRKKVVMLNTGLLRAMEGDELLFIIGHELSHIKYGRWRRLKRIGLPYVIGPQFNELRCDRGGLVASRNIDASVRALLKLATGREFIDRVDVKSLERERAEVPSKLLQRLATHPMIGDRVKALLRFHGSRVLKKG